MNIQKLVEHVDQLLERKQDRQLRSLLVKEDPPTIAEVLED